ncbi:MAG: OmpA family protein [Flavobacteriaceae bacterium]
MLLLLFFMHAININKLVFSTLLSIICYINVFSQNTLVHDVYFETNKHQITETEEIRLLTFISNLSEMDIASISIYGFCDDRGASDYNLKLSKQRAQAIKTFFNEYHIDDTLINHIDGKGEILIKVVETEQLAKIRGLNRKVEIRVYKKKQPEHSNIAKTPHKTPKTTEQRIKDNRLSVGDKIVFDNILFETGYSTIVPESKSTLDSIAKALVERKNVCFTIQGHVCCTKNTNDAIDKSTQKQNLSLTRARFVYDYLAEKGVSKRRMKYEGLSRKFPLGGDSKFDRRVEIVITEIRE